MSISVITACLPTASNYLETCYSSLLRQTIQDWEWVVVFDGPCSGTYAEQLLPTLTSDERVTIVSLSRSHGAATARNIGLATAKHKVFRNLDADDLLNENALEADLEVLRKPGISWCATHSSFFSDENTLKDFPLFRTTGRIEKYALVKQYSGAGIPKIGVDIHFTTLAGYRSLALACGGYRAITHGEDILLGVALSMQSDGWFTQTPSVKYRKWVNQLTATGRSEKDALFLEQSLKEILELVPDSPLIQHSDISVLLP